MRGARGDVYTPPRLVRMTAHLDPRTGTMNTRLASTSLAAALAVVSGCGAPSTDKKIALQIEPALEGREWTGPERLLAVRKMWQLWKFDPVFEALIRHPERARAVQEALEAATGRGADPVRLAAWLGRGEQTRS